MNLNNILSKLKLKKNKTSNSSTTPSDTDTPNIIIKDKRNRPILILRMLSFLIIFLLIFGFLFIIYFVYSSITSSIGQIQSIVAYQTESQIQLIEFSKLDKIEKFWQAKVNSVSPDLTRNPFAEVFETVSIQKIESIPTSTVAEVIVKEL